MVMIITPAITMVAIKRKILRITKMVIIITTIIINNNNNNTTTITIYQHKCQE